MAIVRCSAAVSSINTVITGVQSPVADSNGSAVFTVTAQEATALCQGVNVPDASYTVNPSTGTVDVMVMGQISYNQGTYGRTAATISVVMPNNYVAGQIIQLQFAQDGSSRNGTNGSYTVLASGLSTAGFQVTDANSGTVTAGTACQLLSYPSAVASVLVGCTINGTAYTLGADWALSAMLPTDAAALLAYGFKLVTG